MSYLNKSRELTASFCLCWSTGSLYVEVIIGHVTFQNTCMCSFNWISAFWFSDHEICCVTRDRGTIRSSVISKSMALIDCLPAARVLQVDAVYFFTEGSAADCCRETLSDQVRAAHQCCTCVQLCCVSWSNFAREQRFSLRSVEGPYTACCRACIVA